MKRFVLAIGLVLACSHAATAAPVLLTTWLTTTNGEYIYDDGFAEIGVGGVRFWPDRLVGYAHDSFIIPGMMRNHDLEDLVPMLSLDIDFAVGPLTGVDIFEDARSNLFTRYRYSSGQVTFAAQWEAKNGRLRTGTFTAPIVASISESVTPGFALTVEECCDGSFVPRTADFLQLGTGVFSPHLARYLQVKRHTAGGEFWFAVEALDDPDPFAEARFGSMFMPNIRVEATTRGRQVPEPGGLALLTIAAAALYRRRRSGRMRRWTSRGHSCPTTGAIARSGL